MKRLVGLLFFVLTIKVAISDVEILTSPQDCFMTDYAYGGDNILVSGKYNVKDSAALCQQSCQVLYSQIMIKLMPQRFVSFMSGYNKLPVLLILRV